MGFLDNSGDIVIDAVLTDLGRERLARGDGSFRITKFALADDEINYELFNLNHPSGSAYQDIEILQTPILEAPTDNASGLKHKLLSVARNDMLYLPILKLNEVSGLSRRTTGDSLNTYVICVDENTQNSLTANTNGVIHGFNTRNNTSKIRIDQGLDTGEVSPQTSLAGFGNLIETRYIVEMDNRFGMLHSGQSYTSADPSYIDDDDIASYNLASDVDDNYIRINTNIDSNTSSEVIEGPRGTIFEFLVQASLNLQTSTFYFNKLGGQVTMGVNDYYYIDSFVRIFGATTGYSIDIPVRYIKLV